MAMMAAGADSDDNNKEVFDMDAFRLNFRKMDKIRSFMGIVAGCVAGVLGLTGVSGLGECILCFICLWFGGIVVLIVGMMCCFDNDVCNN